MKKIIESNEAELKVIISKSEYDSFFSKAHNIYSQKNQYYKLKDNLCIRVRQINNEYFIQYKENNKGKDLKALKDSTEYSLSITEIDYVVIINNPDTLYEYLGIEFLPQDKAEYKGFLETIRGHVTLDSKMPDIQIDFNRYNDIIDYELEWEIDRESYKKAVSILKKNGIDINKKVTGVSKLKRLLESCIC